MLKNYLPLVCAAFCYIVLLLSAGFILLLSMANVRINNAILPAILVLSGFLYFKYLSYKKKAKFKQKIIAQYTRLQTIINNVSIALILKDTNGNVLVSNNGHEDIFGQDLKNLIGVKLSELFKNSEDIDEEDNNVIKNKSQYEKIKKLSLKNSQREVWVQLRKAPVLDDDNNVCAIVVTLMNYNKFMETEEKKKTFVATITHDLKTPTNAQIQALDLLLNNTFGELKNEQRQIIKEIKNSCKYMSTLIFSILDSYASESGQTKLNCEQFELSELINECISEISSLATERGQKIKILPSGSKSLVNADRTQIKRVIMNLCANAIRYGRINTIITIEINNDAFNNISFSVKNHSGYIPKEKLSTLFEKFKTASNSTSEPSGSGLGLYLSKQIILSHKGKINAQSSKDNTCTFSFTIPKNLENNNESIIELAG